jgi:hypothetical protein
MHDLTLLSCSFNTPLVTHNMLKTFTALHPECPVLICENSTNDETRELLKTAGVPYIVNRGGLHGPSVDKLIEACDTKYALLVDTDVIFLKNHDDIFESFKSMSLTLMGEIVGDRGGKKLHLRVHPWHCLINVEFVKRHNIKFFDMERQKSRNEKRYDVGSSFFEDIKNNKLKIADFQGNGTYYKHYEGMSWHVNRHGAQDGDIDVDESATHNNQGILEYGRHVLKTYLRETQHLDSQPLVYNA